MADPSVRVVAGLVGIAVLAVIAGGMAAAGEVMTVDLAGTGVATTGGLAATTGDPAAIAGAMTGVPVVTAGVTTRGRRVVTVVRRKTGDRVIGIKITPSVMTLRGLRLPL